jgi:hypothetical protein
VLWSFANPARTAHMSCAHKAGWVGMHVLRWICGMQARLMPCPCTRVPSCQARSSSWRLALSTCKPLDNTLVSSLYPPRSHPAYPRSGRVFSIAPAVYLWVAGSVKLNQYFGRPHIPTHALSTRQMLLHRSRHVRSSSRCRVPALTLSESRCCLEQPCWLCAVDCCW